MKIVERSVSAGDREIFALDEFLSRPLYAHLAHNSDQGPRESPVWFHWDGRAIWIIGGTTFPANLKRDPRCALGIVDWDPATGRSHHVGIRGRATVETVSLERGGVFGTATLGHEQVADERSLLALEVNGTELSLDHGFPARVISPAVPGVHCTKWVRRMTFRSA